MTDVEDELKMELYFTFKTLTYLEYRFIVVYNRVFQPFQLGDLLYTPESDVCRRQILTYKEGPHAERVKIFLMAIDT